VRFIGHLDLLRAMQRALRRSGLPVEYSQGFNPHMLVSFASPLPVGQSGLAELMDVAMAEPVTEAECIAALRSATPNGLPIRRVKIVRDDHPKLMAQLRTASYMIAFDNQENSQSLLDAIPRFLQRDSIRAVRVTKSGERPCDIRPMLHEVSVVSGLPGDVHAIAARVSFTEEQTLKPDLLIRSLAEFAEVEPPSFHVVRTGLYGERGGKPCPLIDC